MENLNKNTMSMIKFKYTPNDQLSILIGNIVENYTNTLPGLLPFSYKNRLSNIKLYAVCHPYDVNGVTKNRDACAVAARSDSDAVYIYSNWYETPGSVIGILEEDASKAKVSFS